MSENRSPRKQIALELKNLEKKFGSKKVLDHFSLTLYEGEILGLFGGSGSGKSVSLRCIIGLEYPDEGQILFKDEDTTKLTEDQLIHVRKKIAYVFQNGALFDSLTVEENIAYPLKEHTKLTDEEIHNRVNEMLELMDLTGTNRLLPNELSGGMQKRAGLARAMILKPEIILFDEPTAGLDPVNTKRLLGNIKKLKERKGQEITGIFVTHDIPAAFEIADRIAILYRGRILVVDTVDQIRKSKDPIVQSFVSGASTHEEPSEHRKDL